MDFDRHNLQPEDAGGMVDGDMDDTYIDHLNSALDWSEREIARLKAENADLRELVRDLVRLPAVPCFDCFGCKYERHHDCESGFKCALVERAKRLGIEVD